MMITLQLTSAQVSALECRGLDVPEDSGEALLAQSFRGTRLVFDASDRDSLFSALTDASNAEDAGADVTNVQDKALRQYARRAARSLEVLASKVLRA